VVLDVGRREERLAPLSGDVIRFDRVGDRFVLAEDPDRGPA
jgi:hypothetical protein